MGPKFKGAAKALEATILEMNQSQLEECKKTLEEKGQVEIMTKVDDKETSLVVEKDLIQIERVTKKETSMIPT